MNTRHFACLLYFKAYRKVSGIYHSGVQCGMQRCAFVQQLFQRRVGRNGAGCNRACAVARIRPAFYAIRVIFLRPMMEKIVSCPENGGTWHSAIRKTEREDQ